MLIRVVFMTGRIPPRVMSHPLWLPPSAITNLFKNTSIFSWHGSLDLFYSLWHGRGIILLVLMNESMILWTLLEHTWTCGEPNFFSGATLAADLLQLGLKRRPILPRDEDPPFLVVTTSLLSPLVSSQISAFFLPRLDLSPRELLLEVKRPHTLVE